MTPYLWTHIGTYSSGTEETTYVDTFYTGSPTVTLIGATCLLCSIVGSVLIKENLSLTFFQVKTSMNSSLKMVRSLS